MADESHTEVAMLDVALTAEALPAVDVASLSSVAQGSSSTALSLVLSAAVPLDNDTAVQVIKALSCGAPVLTDKSGLWVDRPDDHARAAAATLLEHTHFEVLCCCTQQTEDDKRLFRWHYGAASETATATLVALRWPSGQRAFCCFVENKVYASSASALAWASPLLSRFSAHLYVINEKKKPQAVTMLMMQIYPSGAIIERFAERTSAGMQSLRRLLRSVSVPGKPSLPHLDDQQLTTLLIGAAEAKAGLVPLDDAAALRRQLLVHASMLKNPPTGSFGGEGQKNPAVSIGSGVALLNWEPLAMPVAAAAAGAAPAASEATASDGCAAGAAGSTAGSKAASKKKAISDKPTTSPATLQLLQAISAFAPRDEQAQRKHTFKMAKLADVEAGGAAHATGWGGDCGLFHELGVEVLLKVLEHCPLHSRLVLTEFTNKSFRMMRLEPELFSTLRLHHFDSVKLTAQLARATAKRSSTDVIFCPASHFAILLQAKQNVVRHLSFTSGDTPLTAIKASIKLVGARLASLSLRGEGNVNALTITEVGKHCTNLTYLDLNCGKSLGADRSSQSKDEQALIAAVRGMKGLKTLRLPPFQIMSTFIGDWGFVKATSAYKHPETEEEHLNERVSVDDHDFGDGTEGNLTFMDASTFDNAEGAHGRSKFHSNAAYLRQLQSVLPRGCKLTNNGRWAAGGIIASSWGTPTVEGAAEWNIFGANSYKQLSGMSELACISGLGRTVQGSDGSTIINGLVKTVYLQCGDPADLLANGIEPKRFYMSLAAWKAANPEPKEPKPLGAVIET
jgi:hypothetical protein